MKSKLRIKLSRSIPKLVKSPNYFKIYYNELFLIAF